MISDTAHPTHGATLLRLGRSDAAIAALEQARARDPSNPSTLDLLMYAYYHEGQLDRAEACAEALLKLNPNNANALAYVANAAALRGEIDAAVDVIRRARAIDVNNKVVLSIKRDLMLLCELRNVAPIAGDGRTVRDSYAGRCREALASLPPADLIVALFHVEQQGNHVITAIQRQAKIDYLDLITIAASAARATAARVATIVLTDRDTVVPDHPDIAAVIRLPLRPDWIMYERMRAQRAVAATALPASNLAFLDTDIVVAPQFARLFAEEFDVGLTWRPEAPITPINGGMILGRCGRWPQLAAFLDRCLDCYDGIVADGAAEKRYGFDMRQFQGDQLALARAVAWRTPPVGSAAVECAGASIRFFPCRDVNFTFGESIAPDVLADKFAVHFKGGKAKAHAREFVARRTSGAQAG